MEDKVAISQVIAGLPTKVISQMGENYYLVLKVNPDDINGETFRTFYQHRTKEEILAEMWYQVNSPDVSHQIWEVIDELAGKGFRMLTPIQHPQLGTPRKGMMKLE